MQNGTFTAKKYFEYFLSLLLPDFLSIEIYQKHHAFFRIRTSHLFADFCSTINFSYRYFLFRFCSLVSGKSNFWLEFRGNEYHSIPIFFFKSAPFGLLPFSSFRLLAIIVLNAAQANMLLLRSTLCSLISFSRLCCVQQIFQQLFIKFGERRVPGAHTHAHTGLLSRAILHSSYVLSKQSTGKIPRY